MTLEVIPITGLPDIKPGDDLARLVADALVDLRQGDCVVVTQKVVSKAENRLVDIDPIDPLSHKPLVEQESVRILRRRRRADHLRDKPRIRVRQRGHRSLERRTGPGRAPAGRQRPLGAPHS